MCIQLTENQHTVSLWSDAWTSRVKMVVETLAKNVGTKVPTTQVTQSSCCDSQHLNIYLLVVIYEYRRRPGKDCGY